MKGRNMKTQKIYFAAALTLVVALLTMTAIAQSIESHRNGKDSVSIMAKKRNDLTGTWLVDVQITGEAANAAPEMSGKFSRMIRGLADTGTQAPFTGVETYHSDGTVAELTLADYLPPQATPGLGLWERTGEGEFAVNFYGVVIGSTVNPEFQGTYKVVSKLTTNNKGDEFSGPAKVEIFDPSGNLALTLDAIAQGRRAVLEPLQ
jgi:hypothetical protein